MSNASAAAAASAGGENFSSVNYNTNGGGGGGGECVASGIDNGAKNQMHSSSSKDNIDEGCSCKPCEPLKILKFVECLSSTTNSIEMQIIINKYVSRLSSLVLYLYIIQCTYLCIYKLYLSTYILAWIAV